MGASGERTYVVVHVAATFHATVHSPPTHRLLLQAPAPTAEQLFGFHATDRRSLQRRLEGCAGLRECVLQASEWWQAVDRAGAKVVWEDPLMDATCGAVRAHSADDLFSSSTRVQEDVMLDLVGLKLVADAMGKTSASFVAAEALLPTPFLKALARRDGRLVGAPLRRFLTCLAPYRLDRLSNDQVDSQYFALLGSRDEKRLGALLTASLETEARQSAEGWTPGQLEVGSVLRDLLSLSSIVPFQRFVTRPGDLRSAPPCPALDYFRTLPGFPRPTHLDLDNQFTLVRGNLNLLQRAAADLLQKGLKSGRPGVLGWMGQVLRLNQSQLVGLASHRLVADWDRRYASSGFLLNLIAVLLRLFRPLTEKKVDEMLTKVDWEFVKHDWRVVFSDEQKLAGNKKNTAVAEQVGKEHAVGVDPMEQDGRGEDDVEGEDDEAVVLARAIALSLAPHADPGFFPADFSKDFSFISEVFWLTARAMVFLPILRKRFDEQTMELQRRFQEARQRAERDAGMAPAQDTAHKQLMTHIFGWEAQIFDQDFLQNAARWAGFCAEWLRQQAREADAQERFSLLPANLMKGMCDIWTMVASLRGAEKLLSGVQATDAALFCCEFMQRPDLVSSPIVQAKFVDVIVVFQGRAPQVGEAPGPSTSPSKYFGSQRGFAGAVMDEPRIRRDLAPSLMKLYSDVHAIEGIDVDADIGFDKFSVRHRANDVLMSLYNHPLPEPRQSILEFARSNDFDEFLIAAYDTITYNFHDALERVADGRRLEQQLGAEPDPGHRQHRFYQQQRRTARGFMAHSDSTLVLLGLLSIEPEVVQRMTSKSMVRRTAAVLLSCVRALCAPEREALLAVLHPDRWGLQPVDTLARPAGLLATAAAAPDGGGEALARAVAEDPDFEPDLLARAAARDGGEPLQRVMDVLSASGAGQAKGAAAVNGSSGGTPGLSGAGGAGGGGSAVDDAAAAAAVAGVDWASLEESREEAMEVDERYTEACSDYVFDHVDGFQSGHYFDKRRSAAGAAGGAQLRPLAREMRRMPRDLPEPHPDGAIYVQVDENSANFARAVIAGPLGTPYFGGLFVFDVFFPPSYPNEPPLLQLVTTGQGTARFNPNLYADGKVCLSLLGTWHGQENEKWQPGVSSLAQVLLSILGQILVAEPYYNEPGRDAQRGTREGDMASRLYNQEIRLAAVRHAMLDHLRRPDPELAPLIQRHFRGARRRILTSLKPDILTEPVDATEAATVKKLRREFVHLKRALENLGEEEEEEGDAPDGDARGGKRPRSMDMDP